MEISGLLQNTTLGTLQQLLLMSVLAVFVTILFYFLLPAFNTANLFFSTISITTSFVACFAMFLLNDLYGFYNWKKMQKQEV